MILCDISRKKKQHLDSYSSYSLDIMQPPSNFVDTDNYPVYKRQFFMPPLLLLLQVQMTYCSLKMFSLLRYPFTNYIFSSRYLPQCLRLQVVVT